jgi:hypothetical protein
VCMCVCVCVCVCVCILKRVLSRPVSASIMSVSAFNIAKGEGSFHHGEEGGPTLISCLHVCVCVCVCVGRVDMCVCVFEPAFLCILALWKKRNACVRGFERACLCNQKEALNVRLPYVFVCCVLNRPTIAFQPDWKWRPRACLRVYVHVNICTDRLPCVPVHGKV